MKKLISLFVICLTIVIWQTNSYAEINISSINYTATIGITLADTENNSTLIITDLFGNTVSRQDIDEPGYQQVTIDNLNPGFYVVNLISEGSIVDQAKFTSK